MIGVFGGSGFYAFLEDVEQVELDTPYGKPSAPVTIGEVGGARIAFLSRHGLKHELPPHKIPYQANVWAMRELGVRRIIGPNASGALKPELRLGEFVVCDQFVDRTSGRADTFYDGPETTHVSAADPYCPELRALLVETAGFVSRHDAAAVRRLREAGAVIIGKHVMHEFAAGQNVPPTRNPWNLEHYPGGSSAGGGVSVAVGSSLAALGTDAGGSVRKPAAVTGTVGVKPTHGRVSGYGTIRAASAPSLDHVGTVTRTVEDAALVLQAISGFDSSDQRSLDEPVPDYVQDLEAGIAGLRLGIVPEYFAGPELDSEVGAAVEEASDELQRLGAVLVTVELPTLRLTLAAGVTILLAEMALTHRRWIAERPYEYVEATRRMLELGSLLPATQVEQAGRARALIRAEVRGAFRDARLDALVTPTLPRTSMPLAEMVPAVDVAKMVPYTFPWNLTGQPALSLPCGFTGAGLPVGLQIVGRPLDEATVLRIGHAYERETPWHQESPPLFTSLLAQDGESAGPS